MGGSPGQTVATRPLLETKLYIPKWRAGLVPRPRLIERLDPGTETRLTLVSAPAGFGKTTLLAEWLAAAPAGERPAAWVSLDPSDNDPAFFWAYVITALRTVEAGVGESALSLLQSPQPPPVESLLGTLLNEISAISHGFVLVLDDYHLIDAQPIHQGIAFLLDHLPRQMQLIIASRADPPLPLARLRGRRELTELRASDLRFTPDEAAAFLNEVMGLELSAEEVAALEARTEGWISGLQLAALSMQGRDDVAGFITAFTGDDRYIVDYLVEEVLQRQPKPVRDFLLQTSVLDRLSGPLCDAVTGQERGKGMLEALERGNLFVVPLDDKRQWYRYHHLFADVLRAHSMEQRSDRVPTLHRRASEWYEQNGLPSDAIRHALAAEDFERAADLIELSWNPLQGTREDATWLGWAMSLPDEVLRARPVLSVGCAWKLFIGGQIENGEARLRDAERWLDAMADGTERPAGMVVANEKEFRSLPGMVAGNRSFHSQVIGDVAGTEEYARRALELLPEDNYVQRAIAGGILGLAHWTNGELETAHRLIAESGAQMRRAGNIAFATAGTDIRADIRLTQGRLHKAVRTYEKALQLAEEQGGPVMEGTADLYLGLSDLHLERGDLEEATQLLQKSADLGKEAAYPVYEYRSRVVRARMKEAQGDLQGAVDLLDDAERINTGGPAPDLRPEAARRTRVWLAQGKLTEARAWAYDRGLSADDELSFLREFEHVMLARVLIAQYRSERKERSIHEALALLERLLEAAEEGGRAGSAIQILVLQALAHHAHDDIPRALLPLERALTLAEPEGFVQVFVGEGDPMRGLLRHAAAGGVTGDFTRRLLAHLDAPAGAASTLPHSATPGLPEPLTPRELEILRLVAAGMRNQEIADQLVISVATVKRHIANAYGKLGVGHRTEAVARATELHLL